MAESLYCPEQKASSPEFREGYKKILWENTIFRIIDSRPLREIIDIYKINRANKAKHD